MNCPSNEQLVGLILAEVHSAQEAERDHVTECARCAALLKEVAGGLGRLESAMTWLSRDHAGERERLVAALAAAGKPELNRSVVSTLKEVLTMPRTWIGSAVAAALLVGAFFFWHGPGASTLLAQTAQALREVKSYRCKITNLVVAPDDNKKDVETMTWFWTPGAMRYDTHANGKLTGVEIYSKNKPGLDIDYRGETFRRLDPVKGPVSPLLVFSKLADLSGQADRPLDSRSIGGVDAPGYQIAVSRIDPDVGEGTLRLWIDPKTRLPLRVELSKEPHFMVFEDFEWNLPATDWFTLEPPAKFVDKTPTPPGVDEITEQIVAAFKIYAKYADGKYPQATMIYGDVTSEELNHHAGLPSRSPPAPDNKALWEIYGECQPAHRGFGQINGLQRHDAGAVYHGKHVGPKDTNKVLFRWPLVDGRFRVIYGDLRVEDVSATKLKMLETRTAD